MAGKGMPAGSGRIASRLWNRVWPLGAGVLHGLDVARVGASIPAMRGTRPIAAIARGDGQDWQDLLAQMADGWRRDGLAVAGLLAENDHTGGECSAAFLRDIDTGRRFSIQLDAAPAGTACHLDTAGLDQACADLLPRVGVADTVILSKFGKTEAAGAGLLPLFAAAIAAGVPLLTTVSAKHVAAWGALAADAVWLDPAADAIRRWHRSTTA